MIYSQLVMFYISPPVNLPSPQTLMVRLLVSKFDSDTFLNSADYAAKLGTKLTNCQEQQIVIKYNY